MTTKPILFSGPMVRALLDGRKTQTRRVLKPQPPSVEAVCDLAGTGYNWFSNSQGCRPVGPIWAVRKLAGDKAVRPVPYAPGDLLWVREAHYLTDDGESEHAVFAEDEGAVSEHLENMQTLMASHPQIDWSKHLRLRPSINMPRWASRLTLRVTDVRVQRVQEISETDAWSEGCRRGDMNEHGGWFPAYEPDPSGVGYRGWDDAREWFSDLWDSLNSPRGYGWEANPWVVALTFDVIRQNVDEVPA